MCELFAFKDHLTIITPGSATLHKSSLKNTPFSSYSHIELQTNAVMSDIILFNGFVMTSCL